jgi:hypothetical protein
LELSATFTVKAIKKKTSAVFFKDLKVGDTFTLGYDLTGSYGYAPTINIYSGGRRVHANSALQATSNLSNFELKRVGE